MSASNAAAALTGGERTRKRFPLVRGLDPITIIAVICVVVALICAIAPDVVAPYNPNKIGKDLLFAPSTTYWLGTDELGRDILSRIIFGARIDLLISAMGVVLAVAIGVPMGLVSGYLGGIVDSVLMRLQDALLAFPSILFAILVVAALGASRWSIILTVGIIFVPRFARVIRGTVMSLKHEEFVTASRAAGAKPARIIFRHILPNCISPVIVVSTLDLAYALLDLAALSFLGLGVQPPTADWGAMLADGQQALLNAPHIALSAGGAIVVAVLGFNLLGDGLRDVLDPRQGGR